MTAQSPSTGVGPRSLAFFALADAGAAATSRAARTSANAVRADRGTMLSVRVDGSWWDRMATPSHRRPTARAARAERRDTGVTGQRRSFARRVNRAEAPNGSLAVAVS